MVDGVDRSGRQIEIIGDVFCKYLEEKRLAHDRTRCRTATARFTADNFTKRSERNTERDRRPDDRLHSINLQHLENCRE